MQMVSKSKVKGVSKSKVKGQESRQVVMKECISAVVAPAERK